MAEFLPAYRKNREKEGGYVNDPADRGKETYAGISRRFHPYWKGWKIIDQVKQGHGLKDIDARLKANCRLQKMIKEFYKLVFWHSNNLGLIKDQHLAQCVYDTGVHLGAGDAGDMLQRALNVTNVNGKYYPELERDGILGPKTRSAVHCHPYRNILINVFNTLRAHYYVEEMEKDPGQERFIGWFNRPEWI